MAIKMTFESPQDAHVAALVQAFDGSDGLHEEVARLNALVMAEFCASKIRYWRDSPSPLASAMVVACARHAWHYAELATGTHLAEHCAYVKEMVTP